MPRIEIITRHRQVRNNIDNLQQRLMSDIIFGIGVHGPFPWRLFYAIHSTPLTCGNQHTLIPTSSTWWLSAWKLVSVIKLKYYTLENLFVASPFPQYFRDVLQPLVIIVHVYFCTRPTKVHKKIECQ